MDRKDFLIINVGENDLGCLFVLLAFLSKDFSKDSGNINI